MTGTRLNSSQNTIARRECSSCAVNNSITAKAKSDLEKTENELQREKDDHEHTKALLNAKVQECEKLKVEKEEQKTMAEENQKMASEIARYMYYSKKNDGKDKTHGSL
jgi:DNA repair exonuclease SbcCD ATPase subunit